MGANMISGLMESTKSQFPDMVRTAKGILKEAKGGI